MQSLSRGSAKHCRRASAELLLTTIGAETPLDTVCQLRIMSSPQGNPHALMISLLQQMHLASFTNGNINLRE